MSRLLNVYVAVLCITNFGSATAATIFESGALGTTGVTWNELTDDDTLGVNVSAAVFGGVRFQLIAPVITTEIGGHFVRRPNAGDSFFGAIVRLDAHSDFPNSEDLSTSDVRGTALLMFPDISAEVFGEMNLLLEPGWREVDPKNWAP
jgi:hypothetical protein